MSYQGPVEDLYPEQRGPVNNLLKKKPSGIEMIGMIPLGMLITSSFVLIVKAISAYFNDASFSSSYLVVVFVLWILYYLKRRAENRVSIVENGLLLPNYWFKRKLVKWDEIVEISLNEDPNKIEIILDTAWSRVNVTGMQDVIVELSADQYDINNMKGFFEHLQNQRNKLSKAPDTLNERLKKQVDRAWDKRYLRIFENWFDNYSKGVFYLLIFETLFFALTERSLGTVIFTSLAIFYGFGTFLLYLFEKPYSIIGIRPNELGPVIYLPEEIISNIRFVVMAKPFDIQPVKCEVIYGDTNTMQQVVNMIQIHPQNISAGELTHGVAQLTGNHSKAVGARIFFKMNDDDEEYQIEIKW